MRDIFYTVIEILFSRMQLGGVQRFGRVVGWLFWYFLPARRRQAVSTIEKRLQVSRYDAKGIAHKSFIHSAQAFGEIFLARKMDPLFMHNHVLMTDATREQLHKIFNQKRSVVVATGHMGSWELLAGVCRFLLPERNCQVVVRLPKDKALGRLMLRLRSVGHVQILPHRNAARKVLKCLKNKGMTAFLVDHNCSQDEAVFLSFLGKEAAVNMGPALLALRSKALVVPVFLLRRGMTYTLEIDNYLDTEAMTGSREENIKAIAEYYTLSVEKMVKKYPEQWFWMHKRWKTRPST